MVIGSGTVSRHARHFALRWARTADK